MADNFVRLGFHATFGTLGMGRSSSAYVAANARTVRMGTRVPFLDHRCIRLCGATIQLFGGGSLELRLCSTLSFGGIGEASAVEQVAEGGVIALYRHTTGLPVENAVAASDIDVTLKGVA